MTARPTVRGVGAAAAAAIAGASGAAFRSHALLLFASAILAAAGGSCAGAFAAARHRIAAFTWAAPALVAAGAAASVVVTTAGGRATVRVDRARGRWRNVAGTAAGDGGAPGPGRLAPTPGALDALSPSGRWGLQAVAPVPTGTRGILFLPGRRLWVHDPFGLVGVVVATVPPVTVVVHPAPAPVAVGMPPVAAAGVATRPAAAQAGGGGGGELDGVRPYVPGDPLHLVHWPSLARPGPPLAKDFGADAGEQRCVLVDDRAGVHTRESFESMLAAACGLVVTGWHAGTPVVLTTWSGTTTVVGASTDDLERGMVALASMTPRAARGAPPPEGPVITVTTRAAVPGLPASLVATGVLVALP